MRFALLAQNDQLLVPIRDALAVQGIDTSWFATIEQLTACLEEQEFGAILLEDHPGHLDASLGTLQLRAEARTAIVVVGKGGTAAMTHALVFGADDYAFASGDVERTIQRIIARVGVKLRRHRQAVIRIGSFALNAVTGEIESSGRRVCLTARETLLARLLFENPGRIVAADRLHVELCGTSDATAIRAVKQHVYQLRRKLERIPGDGERLRIETVYGAGYRLAR